MADDIQRTIYKLEIDDSAYIKGVDNLSASTQKFTQQQDAANKKLKENEAALKSVADTVEKDRKALENYAGSDTKFRKTLEDNLKASQAQHSTLKKLVDDVRASYERSKKAADDFAQSSNKANGLAGGGRVPVPPVVPQPVPQLIPPAAFEDFDLNDILSQTNIEFEKLRESIAAAELALAGMNEESEEFKQLAPVVDQGKKALADYDAAATKAGTSTLSLRSQIRLGREELVKLEQQGKANTKEYFELEKRVASLTDAFGDQQARIKILASDTKALDFGKGAITAATAAFSAYTSVSVLAGDQSEELQKKTLQLFAAMQLLQSVEQLSNLTRREGTLFTLAQSGAQAAYTAVVGASTGALRAFRIALAATGIGIVIAGIAFLVNKFNELKEAQEEATKAQRELTEIREEAAKSFAAEVTHLTLIKTKLNDLNIPQKERIRLAKEYNKTAEEGNKIDLTQIDNIDAVNAAIDRNIVKIKERAIAKAAENVLAKRAEDLFLEEEKARTRGLNQIREENDLKARGLQTDEQRIEQSLPTIQVTIDEKGQTSLKDAIISEQDRLTTFIGNDPELKKKRDEFNETLKRVGGIISIDDIITIKPTGGSKGAENTFLKQLDELNKKRLDLIAKGQEGEIALVKRFAERLTIEKSAIDRQKNITDPQKEFLKKKLEELTGLELQKALEDYRKKVKDAREKLSKEINDLQNKATEDSLNLIQNEFERRKALIEFNEKQELADAAERQEDRLAALELDKLLLGEQAYQEAKNIIITTGEQESNNILARFAALRQDLATDTFKKLLDSIGSGLNQGLIFRDENLAQEIRDASNRFLEGKITYEQFQKELTAIQIREEGIRRDATLSNQRSQLSELDAQIAATTDKTSEGYKELIKLRDDLRAKIATGEKDDAIKDAEDKNKDENTKKVETLNDYVASVGQLADSVIQFWQAANEAESAALDRSIALQEKRVTAAQRIAERGNAQYLKAEEDRLKELQIKRENAARRELAINAALQASQLLVGITGAISKIATPGIGIAESIGAFAVIASSLAAGYGLVKSLQGNQPRLAKGDPYVKRNGHPSGVDTIPAWLNEGEAVIPTDKNKQYHPSVRAIYDGSVPAEAMNNFVKNYHSVKSVPRVNYERIKESAEIHLGSDGRMSVAIQEQNKLIVENNELQRMTLRAMKNMSVSANIDRDGVSVMVNEYIQQMNINKKV